MTESIADVIARLNAHRAVRATIHDDVRKAKRLGLNPHRIAAESGLTRSGVVKILGRTPSASADVDLAEAADRGIEDVPTREDGPL